MTPLYRLGTAAYHTGLRLAAKLGHARAATWVAGRATQRVPPKPAGTKRLWMHCASLGEWEQGRPVLQHLRAELPGWEVALSFYSPSGYTRVKPGGLVDRVLYLPADSPTRAEQWVQELSPDLAVFVKYEFWYYHLRALEAAKIPTWLIAASFRPGQAFFAPWGAWHRRMLRSFDGIITQSPAQRELLWNKGRYPVERAFTAGDPRMDRTLDLAGQPFTDERLAAFCNGHRVIMAGSVWPEDMRAWELAWPEVPQEWRIVFAPHRLDEEELARTQVQWEGVRYTRAEAADLTTSRVLILDTIGILSRAYRYADVAYVGGGFKTGLHNTLEPMAYGLPTIFGPKHEKFPEADYAIREGGGASIRSASELAGLMNNLSDPNFRSTMATKQVNLARSLAGAGKASAGIILNHLGPKAF